MKTIAMLLIGALAASTAWANDEQQAEKAADKKPARDECVFFSTVYDWRALDDSNLVIWAPNKRDVYHAKLIMPLMGLKFAHTLAFIDGNNDRMLCSYGRDAIGVNEVGSPQKSSIISMTKLDEAGLAALSEKYKVDLSRDKKKKIPTPPKRESAQ